MSIHEGRRATQTRRRHSREGRLKVPIQPLPINESDLEIPGLNPHQLPIGHISEELGLRLARRDVALTTNDGFNAFRRQKGLPEQPFAPPTQPSQDELQKKASEIIRSAQSLKDYIDGQRNLPRKPQVQIFPDGRIGIKK